MTEQRSDRTAEQALLYACLVSKPAREEARKHIVGPDFDNPSHEVLWNAMAQLDRHDKKVDGVTLLAAVGSDRAREVIPDIVTATAIPEAVAEYAQIVRGWSVRRRIDGAAMSARHQAFNPDTNVGTLAAQVASEFIAIRDGGAAATDDITAVTARELLEQVDDEPEWLIPNLLEKRDRLILTGEEGLGKALAIDTPVPTPHGWTTMGELHVSSWVFSPDGKPARVVAVSDVMSDRPCYRVNFSDGSSIVADANHLWVTETYASRMSTNVGRKRIEPTTITTERMAETVTVGNRGRVNHSIDTTAPLQYPERDLLIDPYVLGAWLGDGSSTVASIVTHHDDHEIVERIAETWPVRKLKAKYAWGIGDGKGGGKRGTETFAGCLRRLGVFGNKHIPATYLRASVSQRLALLQGLMDTDGTVSNETRGGVTCEFSVVSKPLADGVLELLLSLGIKVSMKEGPAKIDGRVVGTRYRLAFATDLPVFHLRRKAERVKPLRTQRARRRYVVSVEKVESVPVRCIQVDREDGMFVAARECIPTHNSHMLRQIAVHVAAGLDPFHDKGRMPAGRALIVDCENTWSQVRRKLRPAIEFASVRGEQDTSDRVVVDCTNRMDITRDRDLARVHQLLDAYQPDVVVIGPLYRLVPRALQTDDDTAPVLAALDTIRDRGAALLMEAHAGHALKGGSVRDMRPRGSSSLMGWPEFGFGMRAVAEGVADFVPWRGQREERDWPQRVRRSHGFRWMPMTDTADYSHIA